MLSVNGPFDEFFLYYYDINEIFLEYSQDEKNPRIQPKLTIANWRILDLVISLSQHLILIEENYTQMSHGNKFEGLVGQYEFKIWNWNKMMKKQILKKELVSFQNSKKYGSLPLPKHPMGLPRASLEFP